MSNSGTFHSSLEFRTVKLSEQLRNTERLWSAAINTPAVSISRLEWGLDFGGEHLTHPHTHKHTHHWYVCL